MREQQRTNEQDTKYDGRCRKLSSHKIEENVESGKRYVIRAKIPQDGHVEFNDMVRGKISFRWDMVEDQVLMKSDGYPTYHLANVVDDHLMRITHIIRGEEWLTSTPKHIFLYQALDLKQPVFAHLPLLLNPDKSKLSKRQGDVAVEDFILKGYLPEALVNYVALLGWHSSEDQEIFSLKELEQEFSLKRINKAGAVFDQEKLKWLNGHYIRSLDTVKLAERLKIYFRQAGITIDDKEKYYKVINFAKERINLLPDIIPETEMFYSYLDHKNIDSEIIEDPLSRKIAKFWADELSILDDISDEEIKNLIKKTTDKLKVKGKKLYFPLRLALYGKEHGPNIPILIELLGKEESIKRLRSASGV